MEGDEVAALNKLVAEIEAQTAPPNRQQQRWLTRIKAQSYDGISEKDAQFLRFMLAGARPGQ